MLRDDTKGMRGLGKVEKVYIDNPSLMTVLADNNPYIGNLRETFFYNRTRVVAPVSASRESDFRIGEHTFEVGGRGKGLRQVASLPGGIVVRDNIEYGFDRFTPLGNTDCSTDLLQPQHSRRSNSKHNAYGASYTQSRFCSP